MWLEDDEEICCGKQAKEDINFIAQKMFSYGLYMSLTSICNIMLLVGFFESSKSHLSSDRRDRSCSSIEGSCVRVLRSYDA